MQAVVGRRIDELRNVGGPLVVVLLLAALGGMLRGYTYSDRVSSLLLRNFIIVRGSFVITPDSSSVVVPRAPALASCRHRHHKNEKNERFSFCGVDNDRIIAGRRTSLYRSSGSGGGAKNIDMFLSPTVIIIVVAVTTSVSTRRGRRPRYRPSVVGDSVGACST